VDIFAREILDDLFERTLAGDDEAADLGGRQARGFGQQRQSAIAALARDNFVVARLGARHDDEVVEQAYCALDLASSSMRPKVFRTSSRFA